MKLIEPNVITELYVIRDKENRIIKLNSGKCVHCFGCQTYTIPFFDYVSGF